MSDIRERLRKAADNIESRFGQVFEGVTCAEAADIIDKLMVALKAIDRSNDSPRRFNKEIDNIVREALKAVKGEQQ